MAVSERRGLARGSPAELGQQLVLLLLLGCCCGRIHRLVLTVSLTAWRSGAEGAGLSRRSLWLGVVSSYFPFSLRGMERSGAPHSRPRVVSSDESPLSSGWSCLAGLSRVVPLLSGAGLHLRGTPVPTFKPSKFFGSLWALPRGVPRSSRMGSYGPSLGSWELILGSKSCPGGEDPTPR